VIIDLDPPRGFGDLQIGMPIEAAERVLRAMPGYVSPVAGEVRNKGFAHYDSQLSISLDFGIDGVVRAIEFFRPDESVEVTFCGLSLFEEPADRVISRLSEMFQLEIEEHGLNVIAPEVFIGLWRSTVPDISDDEDGRYF
jgi:hypothetical protein